MAMFFENKILNRITDFLLLIVLAFIIIYGYKTWKELKYLEEKGIKIRAVAVEVRGNKTVYVDYYYHVNGFKYEGSCIVGYPYQNIREGQSFPIFYDPKNPNNSAWRPED